MTMEQLLHPSTISLLHRTYLAFLLSSSSWVQSVSQPASQYRESHSFVVHHQPPFLLLFVCCWQLHIIHFTVMNGSKIQSSVHPQTNLSLYLLLSLFLHLRRCSLLANYNVK